FISDAGVELRLVASTTRRVVINDLLVNATNYALKTAISGAGAMIACTGKLTVQGQQTSCLLNSDSWLLELVGTVQGGTGAANACANGSIMRTTAGINIRKAGAWAAL